MFHLPLTELYELSISHPELLWDELAQQVVWDKPYTSVIDDKESPTPNWFVGGEINMSYNCLDKAIEEGYGDDVAIFYESPVTDTSEKITYKQLLRSVELLAGVMVGKCGIKKGDIVLMYFPVIPQCLIAMLACTRIGAIYSLVFGGFPPKPISTRIQHIEPKLILTTNVGFKLGTIVNYKQNMDLAIEMSGHIPEHCIVYNRPNTESAKMIASRDLDWTNEMIVSTPQRPISIESSHPMFIIYTSGTTGEPKGLVMVTGNCVVFDKYQMKYLLDMKPGECFWMLSDFVWISGQTLLSYGPLLARGSTIIYEGEYTNSTSTALIPRIISKYKVYSFNVSSTIIRALRNNCTEEDFKQSYSNLRMISTGGEISDSGIREWLSKSFNSPVYNLWGQTETSGPITSSFLGFKRDNYNRSLPMLGCLPKIIDMQTGIECPTESVGRVLLKIPNTPAMATTFFKDHSRYLRTYYSGYPGYYDTRDSGKLMSDGSLEVLSRIDDVIQVSATPICGGAIEEICLKNNSLINAAVIPLNDPITGQVPFGFLVKRNECTITDEEIIKKTIDLVNDNMGEFIRFQQAVIIPDLPITRSFKISKYSLTAMVNGTEFEVPSTVVNPHIYLAIHEILVKNGFKATLPTDL